jgi:hypothetical protein
MPVSGKHFASIFKAWRPVWSCLAANFMLISCLAYSSTVNMGLIYSSVF